MSIPLGKSSFKNMTPQHSSRRNLLRNVLLQSVGVLSVMLTILSLNGCASSTPPDQWPDGGNEARPRSRWWWMGSAVDSANLRTLIEQYDMAGLGGLEICPIYGVQGNDEADIPFLSDRWMQMYAYAQELTAERNMALDLTCGTGWPFGGPNVSGEMAAQCINMGHATLTVQEGDTLSTCIVRPLNRKLFRSPDLKLVGVYAYAAQEAPEVEDMPTVHPNPTAGIVNNSVEYAGTSGARQPIVDYQMNRDTLLWRNAPVGTWNILAIWQAPTYQKVKRAAPGGEGWVMDYFDAQNVRTYLMRFDTAFAKARLPFPSQMFSDSYEVYGADFTTGLFDTFRNLKGYDVQDYLPQLLDPKVCTDSSRRIRADYCEVIDHLLRHGFLSTWNNWLHANGSTSREQAHGSVANLLDLYAASDVPECETYGRAKAHVRGLEVPDTFQRKAESDKSIMKFASSGAHVMGKKFTSSETLTWASEHFRTTPAICKPELDAIFLSGINRIYFHGAAYSPTQAEWPGWKFYASVDWSPTNVMWEEMKQVNKYIWRVQSFLQQGRSDADVLLYFPMNDVWYGQNLHFQRLSIENLQVYAADFLALSNTVENAGYQTDYISDNQILDLKVKNGKLVTKAGVEYKTMILPNVRFIHANVLTHVVDLINQGASIAFLGHYPSEAPGLAPATEQQALAHTVAQLPEWKCEQGQVQTIAQGKGTVILTHEAELALKACPVALTHEHMTEYGLQYIRRANPDGYTYFVANLDSTDVDCATIALGVPHADVVLYEPTSGRIGRAATDAEGRIRLQLISGQSIIVRTYNQPVEVPTWTYLPTQTTQSITLDRGWTVTVTESQPALSTNGVFDTDTLAWMTSLPDTMCLRNSALVTYACSFNMPEGVAIDQAVLSLENVKYTADVTINGKSVGLLWAFPYVVDVSQYLTAGQNTISIAVRSTAANRIAQMDRDGVVWRKFKDTNLLDVKGRVRDYAWWPIDTQGLHGPVVINFSVK